MLIRLRNKHAKRLCRYACNPSNAGTALLHTIDKPIAPLCLLLRYQSCRYACDLPTRFRADLPTEHDPVTGICHPNDPVASTVLLPERTDPLLPCLQHHINFQLLRLQLTPVRPSLLRLQQTYPRCLTRSQLTAAAPPAVPPLLTPAAFHLQLNRHPPTLLPSCSTTSIKERTASVGMYG